MHFQFTQYICTRNIVKVYFQQSDRIISASFASPFLYYVYGHKHSYSCKRKRRCIYETNVSNRNQCALDLMDLNFHSNLVQAMKLWILYTQSILCCLAAISPLFKCRRIEQCMLETRSPPYEFKTIRVFILTSAT